MFKNISRSFMLSAVCILLHHTVFSNNLRITNISKTAYNKVKFDISWDNSWYVAGYPANHDAVWVFVKYYECGVTPVTAAVWKHALLSTTMTTHTFTGVEAAQPITENNRLGIAGGHNTGVLIRRPAYGTGNIADATCELTLASPLDPKKKYEFKVFGLEMVQVPEGEYYLGDGFYGEDIGQFGPVPYSSNTLRQVNSAKIFSKKIESELATQVNDVNKIALDLPANYPKGFAEFYCMKYEITAGDYVAFLNTLNITQARNLMLPIPTFGDKFRATISLNTALSLYVTSRPDRACNYLGWKYFASFLDWAALRPMSEPEYEKSCRGFALPVKGELACGTQNIKDSINLAYSINGVENGQEKIEEESANVNAKDISIQEFYLDADGKTVYSRTRTLNRPSFVGGDMGNGPLSVGIFSRTSLFDRVKSGATFFGIMEMSGNLWETVITCNKGGTDLFTGEYGNGNIGIDGYYDVASWPSQAAVSTNTYPVGSKGGSFGDPISIRNYKVNTITTNCYLSVSERTFCTNATYVDTPTSFQFTGGRGVR